MRRFTILILDGGSSWMTASYIRDFGQRVVDDVGRLVASRQQHDPRSAVVTHARAAASVIVMDAMP